MSVIHCSMLEVMLVNNICIVWSLFSSQSRDRSGCFHLLFPYIDPDWFSRLLFEELYDSSIPITSASVAAVVPSAEIFTLMASVMKFAKKDCLHIQMILYHHGWPSTQPGTCTQPCPTVHTAVPPLFCVQAARLCRGSPVIIFDTRKIFWTLDSVLDICKDVTRRSVMI